MALGGLLLKGVAKISVEKGFTFGAKKVTNHMHDKNRGKDTAFSRFLEKIVGVSNEELVELINARCDEIKDAMASPTIQLDETGEGLKEMMLQVQEMMNNYQDLGYEDKQFVQSLKEAVNPDTLASEIVDSLKRQQGPELKLEEITSEIEGLFRSMGWSEKFHQLQSSLDGMEIDIEEILERTHGIADDVSQIKDQLEDDNLGKKKTEISDSVMTRSNVITAGGDVINVGGGGKYIGDGAVNIEGGGDVNYTVIDGKSLTENVWKDVLSGVIKDIGIGADLDRDLKGMDEQNLSYSDIAMKFKEVDSLYDNFEMESDTLLRMGNALYYSGEYKKSYECYMRALKERRSAAMANMGFLFSDKNFRDRILTEISNISSKLDLGLKELYQNNDLRNYRVVKKIHDELGMFENKILASVEGVPVERERKGTEGGIDQRRYEPIASMYDDIFQMLNEISDRAERIQTSILAGNSSSVADLAAPVRNDILKLKSKYSERMNIIKEAN